MLNTAHPMTDAQGVTWNIGATVLSGLKYHLVKIPPVNSGSGIEGLLKTLLSISKDYIDNHSLILLGLQNGRIVASIPSSHTTHMTYNHGFTMTEHYVILMEQPYLINCVKMAQIGIRGKSIIDTLEWNPNLKVKPTNKVLS
jgi:hypothetical protein